MLLGAATHMRSLGMDPGDYIWVANDISPVAVACLAVNAFLWQLGQQVIFGVANSLADPLWPERAVGEQIAVLEHRAELPRARRWSGCCATWTGVIAGEPDPGPRAWITLPPIPDIQSDLFGEGIEAPGRKPRRRALPPPTDRPALPAGPLPPPTGDDPATLF